MRRRFDVKSVERKALLIALPVVVGGSIMANVVTWDVKWQIPFVFVALYLILSVALEIRENQVRQPFTHYSNSDEFFTSFSRLVHTAERRISTTYMRKTPPSSFRSPAAERYFQDAVQWMRNHAGASFHRIIGVPTAEPYRGVIIDWLREHHREMSSIPNYHARVVPLDGGVDAINVAIVDEKAVLISLTSEGSFMSGHRLDSRESVSSFRDYYSSWWATAKPLGEFLRQVDTPPGQVAPTS
jgi:hypothetical protein